MRKGHAVWGDAIWCGALCAVIALFAVPVTASALLGATTRYPYLMGFAKFVLLATMGELLALRISKGAWKKPAGLLPKAAAWGIVGLLVVLMFTLFSGGVAEAADKGLLPVGRGSLRTFLLAFWTSAIMNVTFGPVFMAAHRVSDAYIEARASGRTPRLAEIVAGVDWRLFISFVVGRTIPLFWIPAHTVAFLLPPEYRVLMAAVLSIALGAILSWAKKKKAGEGGQGQRRLPEPAAEGQQPSSGD